MTGSLTWEQVLDRIEREMNAPVTEGVQLTLDLPKDPIPVHLAHRAREVSAMQQERMRTLRIDMARAREQLAALDLVPSERGATAAYLDVVA